MTGVFVITARTLLSIVLTDTTPAMLTPKLVCDPTPIATAPASTLASIDDTLLAVTFKSPATFNTVASTAASVEYSVA